MKNLQRKIILVSLAVILFPSILIADTWYELYQRAIEQIENGRYSEAADTLWNCLNKDDTPKTQKRTYGVWKVDYYPYYYLGLCYYKLGDYNKAIVYLDRSVLSGPIKESSELYANLRMIRGEAEKAIRPLDNNLVTTTTTTTITTTTLTSTSAAVQDTRIADAIERGKELYNSGKYSLAKVQFNKVIQWDRNNQEAREWLEKSDNRVKFNDLVKEGSNLEQRGDYQGAIGKYKQAQRYEADGSGASNLIRSAENKLRSQQAVSEKDEKITGLIKLGTEFYNKKQYERARSEFEKVLNENPGNAQAKKYLKDIDQKIAAEIASYEKESTTNLLKNARRSIDNGELITARERLNSVINKDSGNKEAQALMTELNNKNRSRIEVGLNYYLKGELVQAEQVLKRTILISDSSPGLFALLGSIQYTRYMMGSEKDQSLIRSAEEYFRKVLELNRNYELNKKIFSPKVIEYFKRL